MYCCTQRHQNGTFAKIRKKMQMWEIICVIINQKHNYKIKSKNQLLNKTLKFWILWFRQEQYHIHVGNIFTWICHSFDLNASTGSHMESGNACHPAAVKLLRIYINLWSFLWYVLILTLTKVNNVNKVNNSFNKDNKATKAVCYLLGFGLGL